MHSFPRYAMEGLCRGACVILLGFVCSGCATPALNSARHDFYRGKFDAANQTLTDVDVPSRDRVLFLMERGAVRQMLGDYEGSSKDFIEAADRIIELETYSVSKGGASMLTNDEVQDFRGVPFERSLLHAFTAINHLSQGHWNDSGVESRRILLSLEPVIEKGYPDDAFSRYMAGFGLELNDDPS
ncbi:MAG: hypothetical protein KJ626_09645, partial [Verrucomicrobia bacterium]|nr:hypothetical protein [Verrucomicrobiota bacterium]